MQTPHVNRSPATHSRGFTLVELMVTLAVAAVLLMMASPSFSALLNGNRLTGAASDLVAALQSARMEAVRLNARVQVCGSEDGTTCGGDPERWTGWVVLADADRDGDFETVVRTAQVQEQVQVLPGPSMRIQPISFRPDGFAYGDAGGLLTGAVAVCIETTRPAENLRLVTLEAGSKIDTLRADAGGECSAPQDLGGQAAPPDVDPPSSGTPAEPAPETGNEPPPDPGNGGGRRHPPPCNWNPNLPPCRR